MTTSSLGKVYADGDVLIRQGDVGDSMFVIQAGQAEILVETNGAQTRINVVGEGEIIGEHKITFHMAGEEFDLVHRAHDRIIYALGALAAGKWLVEQPAGLYSASDWLASLNS